ncbi:MAG: magnesium chelatase ATPase subunit I, partial [Pseudanabaenaceae cyanobacterium]
MIATPVKPAATTRRPVFPFSAVIGQEEMKLSLLLNVIDPKIGGVMVMGDRGTGKSTTVRAMTDLLPEIEVVADDPFNSHP